MLKFDFFSLQFENNCIALGMFVCSTVLQPGEISGNWTEMTGKILWDKKGV